MASKANDQTKSTNSENGQRPSAGTNSLDDYRLADDGSGHRLEFERIVNSSHTSEGNELADTTVNDKDPCEDKRSGHRGDDESEDQQGSEKRRREKAEGELSTDDLQQSIKTALQKAAEQKFVQLAAYFEVQERKRAEQQEIAVRKMFDIFQHQLADLRVRVERPDEWAEAHHLGRTQSKPSKPDERRDGRWSLRDDKSKSAGRHDRLRSRAEDQRVSDEQQYQLEMERAREREQQRLDQLDREREQRDFERQEQERRGRLERESAMREFQNRPYSHPQPGGVLGSMLSEDVIGKVIVQSITKYNGLNYEVWAEEVERVFVLDNKIEYLYTNMIERHGLNSPEGREDLRLASFLESNIDAKFRHLIRKDGSAVSQIWSALREKHGHELKLRTEEGILRLIRLAKEGPKASLIVYLDLMMNTVYDLQRRGATVDDFVSAIVLSGIPPQYTYLKSHVKHLDQTCDEKINLIRRMYDSPQKTSGGNLSKAPKVMNVARESRPKSKRNRRRSSKTSQHSESESEQSAQSGPVTKFRASKSKSAKSGACFKCGRHGHWKASCKMQGTVYGVCDECHDAAEASSESEESSDPENVNLIYDDRESGEESVPIDLQEMFVANQVIVNNVQEMDGRDRWVFDTGSSVHIANDRKWFISSRPTSVKFGTSNSKSTLKAEAIGTVRFRLRCGREFTVDDVYFCPTARMNLMTNLNLSPDFSFKVTPERTIARHTDPRTGRKQSFDFAKAEGKQNVILVAAEQESVLVTLRSKKQSAGNDEDNQHQSRQRGKQSDSSSRERSGQSSQPLVTKRGRGRPKKCPPASRSSSIGKR